MERDKILSAEMAQSEIDKLNTRKNAIAEEITEKRGVFESADVETRDAVLEEVSALEAEATQIETDVKELEELRGKFEEQEQRMSLIRNVEPTKVEERVKVEERKIDQFDTPEYRKAWVDSIRSNNDAELRAMTTTMDNVPIPTLMQGYVETAWEKFGKFSRIVSKSFVKGYMAIPVELSADPAVWHDENSAMPAEETITLGQILLKPKMIKKWISITDELAAMSPEEFMRYLADELVYRVVLLLDHAIISGSADAQGNGVVGIVGNDNTEKVTSALTFNAINSAVAELDTFENLVVAMNQKTFFTNYMGLKDLQDRPIYQIATDNTGRPQYFINGIRVEFTTALPAYDDATAGQAWAVVGNFRGYRLNMPEGETVKMLYDPYTMAREDKAIMVGRLYVAGNVVRLKHFAQLNKAA